MARTLYILGAAAWVAAGATTVLCLLEKPWQNLSDDKVASSSVVSDLVQTQSSRPRDSREQVPALVREAQAFARYLNPPAPPKPLRPAASQAKVSVASAGPEVKPVTTSVKFELHGISYHRSKPSRSMALVWDAANGYRWVKQGAQIGHVVIEEIHSSAISYSDGRGVHEMALNNLVEATTMVADTGRSDPVPSKPHRQGPPVERWAPVRGIRQMPAERVAAKLGLTSRDTDADM